MIELGAWYSHECDNCGYTVNTQGPWEFYRDKEGTRKPYGHPGPTSLEAEKRGISGLCGIFYCNKCDAIFEAIIVEFKKPTRESLDVWRRTPEPKDECEKREKIECPVCGNTKLLFDDRDIEEIKCPQCKKGKFISWMDANPIISI